MNGKRGRHRIAITSIPDPHWFVWLMALLAALMSLPAGAGLPQGIPPVVRFVPDIPDFSHQTSELTQGPASVIYIATGDGLLSFDGQRWTLVRTPSQDNLQTVAFDGGARVYAGGYNQIGYIDSDNDSEFHDLSPLFRSKVKDGNLGDVFHALPTPDGVFFISQEYLFRYDPKVGGVQVWQNPGHPGDLAFEAIQVYHGEVVVDFHGDSLHRFHEGQWLPISPPGGLHDSVFDMAGLPDGGLLLLTNIGPWREYLNGEIKPYAMPDGVPQPGKCTSDARLDDGTLALACDDGVLRMIDAQAHRVRDIRISDAVLNGVKVASDGGLLVNDNLSVYHVPWPPRWSIINSQDGLHGDVSRLRRWGSRWVAASDSGTYIAESHAAPDAPAFHVVNWSRGDSGDLLAIDDNTALAAVNFRVGVVTADAQGRQQARQLEGKPLNPLLLVRAHDPSFVYAAGDNGLWILKGQGADWHPVLQKMHEPDAINTLVEEGDLQLWYGSDRDGVHRMTLSPDRSRVIDDHAFGAEDGIGYGMVHEAEVYRWKDGSLVVTTTAGLFRWNGKRFQADSLEGLAQINDPKLTVQYFVAPGGDEWAINGRHVFHRGAGQQWRSEPVQGIAQGQIGSYAFDDDGSLLLTCSGEIIRYDPHVTRASARSAVPTVRVRAVEWEGPDGSTRLMPLHPHQPAQFTMGNFTLRFQLSLPEFRTNRPTSFQDRLVGEQPDFSSWSVVPEVSWNKLDAGEYSYVARARDVEGNITESEPYRFVVLQPWYRAPWAYALGGILLLSAMGAFALILSEFRTRRLRTLTEKLEAMVTERTRELANANIQLEQLALEDSLTEVANRRGLDASLRQAWQRCFEAAKPMAIIVVDIDHFKSINDRLGHSGGDELLKKVSQILMQCLRRTEDCIGRFGGDEFVAGLPGADIESAFEVAETMRSRVESSGLGTISVGVAARQPRPDEPVVNLLNEADVALYKCKQQGRNRVVAEHPGIESI